MIEITGQYNTAICYTGALEDAAAGQIRAVCDQPEFSGCKIRIMPDVHAGTGCTIGTTMTITDKVVPGMVGWTSAAAWKPSGWPSGSWTSPPWTS